MINKVESCQWLLWLLNKGHTDEEIMSLCNQPLDWVIKRREIWNEMRLRILHKLSTSDLSDVLMVKCIMWLLETGYMYEDLATHTPYSVSFLKELVNLREKKNVDDYA